jgi:hypothetical protein
MMNDRPLAACLVGLALLCIVVSGSDVAELRRTLEKEHPTPSSSRQPIWVPNEDSGIVLSNWCRQYALGCSDEYVEWLQSRLITPIAETSAPSEILEDEEAAAAERHVKLLEDRLREEQRAHADLLATLLSHRPCPRVLTVDVVDATISDEAIVEYLAWLAGTIEWITVVCLPVALQQVAPCTIVVALLVWALFDMNVEPVVLCYVQGNVADAPDTARRVLGDSLLAFQWVECVHRLRLLMTLSMFAFVIYSMWALGRDLWSGDSGGVFWVLSYVVPQQYLHLATLAVTASYTLTTVVGLAHEVNVVVSERLDAAGQIAQQYEQALHHAAAQHINADAQRCCEPTTCDPSQPDEVAGSVRLVAE